MHIIRSLEQIETIRGPVVVAVGVFDGVHLGHQHVIDLCRKQAASEQAEPWVMTFDPHPLKVVQPASAPLLLTSLSAKLDLLASQKITGCMVIPFTQAFSEIEPEVFLDQLVRRIPNLKGLVIGENWRFGRRARGDVTLLHELSKKYQFHVSVAKPVISGGSTVSSSRIREAIAQGQLDTAVAMLGRSHSIRGNVVHGLKRGRRLGFPTANIDVKGYAVPPAGIYAAAVKLEDHTHQGALYLPAHPEPHHGNLEVHVIDFQGDLYGKELHVEIIRKIREDNLRFPNEADLIQQIRSDVAAIREIFT